MFFGQDACRSKNSLLGHRHLKLVGIAGLLAIAVLSLSAFVAGQSSEPPSNQPAPATSSSSPPPSTSPAPPAAPAGTDAQSPPAAASASIPAAQASELASHDEVTTFKVKVNLVLVRVVVRDSKGNPVSGLHKEDFDVLDNNKPQTISQFAMEGPGVKPESASVSTSANGEAAPAHAPVIPTHFVAYVFDDVHIDFGDLARLREAAIRHLDTLLPTDRAAILTTSGQGNLDFTDDHALLRKALAQLKPTTVARSTQEECPDESYYEADLIQNKKDSQALAVATADALACEFNNDSRFTSAANALAQSTAARTVMQNEHESRLSLSVFHDVLRRMSVLPGQRTMLILSPGFLTSGFEDVYINLIDQALREQVIISALNARGLYTVDPIGDVAKSPPISQQVGLQKLEYQQLSDLEADNLMRDMADGTGGTYFHNSNDLYTGLQRIATTPEFYYVLGFAPQNLKLDGRFHNIKVVVKNPPKVTVQARRGYYAPKHATNAAEEAKQEIEDALFSQEELHDLPIDLHTQFFKATETDAQLAVLVHIDARKLHFQHAEGRNANQLTIVSGLFDRNGKFITANEKILDMHLKDDTLANKLERGLTLKSNFDVKPGTYVVRLVVRDAGGQISAANGAIEIP